VRRNKVRASTAKRARSRQNILDRMQRLEKPPSNEIVKVNLGDAAESANKILTVDNLNFKNIIKNFSLEIIRGEKVGLIGKNGVGKSTLLKLIVGDLKADSGEIKIGNRVKVGYLSQGHEELNVNATPIEELVNEFNLTIERARAELARLDLGAQIVEKNISELSGGEKTRVALAKLILTGANFLLLDEPTNHLDLPAREAIESALKIFEGTILIVTHDRYLLDSVTSRVIEFEKREVVQPKTVKPKPISEKISSTAKIKSESKNEIQLEKLEMKLKMTEMELKMLEREINGEVDPAKLAELAAEHKLKSQELDDLYMSILD
ncbi:MAG: ABC-F family ATP-binding cassette domain-containing protein, partial [Selenomonadaceae bacterium]|nr:ABC-F family ATP-binding cassette domain-containing protein [Selenomonadaceae bacterium]